MKLSDLLRQSFAQATALNQASRGEPMPTVPGPMKDMRDWEPRPAPQQRHSKRGFAINANTLMKMVAGASRGNTGVDYDLRRSLEPMRAFSRDLCSNTSVGKRYLQLVATHVVGPNGFMPKWRPMNAKGKVDAGAAKALKDAFAIWCEPKYCDITQKLSFTDLEQVAIKTAARDGELLIRRVYGSNINEFNYALQLLDVDRIATQFDNLKLPNGNQVHMGVEMTEYQRPVAIHLHRQHPGNTPYTFSSGDRYERVPIENLIHWFMPDRPEQTRGYPWSHAIMTDSKNMAGFIEAAIVAARVGASKMGWITSPDGSGDALSDGEDDDGTLYTEAEPGKFGVLPSGYTFESFDPDYPSDVVESFLKTMMRFQAMGLGVAHHTLSGDLEGVNFSSARAGVLEERDEWMRIQNAFKCGVLDVIASDWLKFAMLGNMIKLPSGSVLPIESFAKYDAASWQGRRWAWVDPEKDTAAMVAKLENGLTTFRKVLAEQGDDLDEVWQELADEYKMAETMGVPLPFLVKQKMEQAKVEAAAKQPQPQSQPKRSD